MEHQDDQPKERTTPLDLPNMEDLLRVLNKPPHNHHSQHLTQANGKGQVRILLDPTQATKPKQKCRTRRINQLLLRELRTVHERQTLAYYQQTITTPTRFHN